MIDAAIRRSLAGSIWVTPAIALALVAVSWPFPRVPAASPLDQSWQAALFLAIQRGVHFGPELAWSYGPLGFLTIPWPWYGPLTILALLVALAIHLGLCIVAVWSTRRVLPLWAAVPVAYLAARGFSAFEPSEALLSLTIAGSAILLLWQGEGYGRARLRALLVGGGLLAGAAALGKFSSGAFVGLIIAATAAGVARPWWRGPVIVAGVGGAAALVIWLATGQSLLNIPTFLGNALETVRGYSEAMGTDRSSGAHWYLLAYVVGVATVAWVAMPAVREHASGWSRASLAALAGVAALGTLAFFKIAFVRWGLGYAFGALLATLLAVVPPKTPRSTFLMVFTVVFMPLLSTLGSLQSLSPVDSLRSLGTELATAVSPDGWAAAERETGSRFAKAFALQPEVLAAVRGHPTHADPWQVGAFVAWPDLDWRPLPGLQSYATYTSALDELNVALLDSPNAPERILRAARSPNAPVEAGPPTIDGRSGWFDSPAAMLESFCRYDEVAASGTWEVLARTARSCGEPELLSTVTANAGAPIVVPRDSRPDRFVVARIYGLLTPIDMLLTAAFKAPEWYITANGDHRFRLVIGTAADGLLMAVPASIHRSPGFEFGPPWTEIEVERRDGAPRELTVEFLSVPLAPA